MLPEILEHCIVEDRLDRLHRLCLEQCVPGGLHLEFGVCEGTSLRMLRELIPETRTIYGFDSFLGLPEEWNGNPAGTFKTSTRIELPNVILVEGWFEDTVPAFAARHAVYASYIHIDCDLYSSTRTVLDGLKNNIVAGTVIVFDEFFGYEGWERHEHKAFMDFIKATGKRFEVIARHTHYRAGIRITS